MPELNPELTQKHNNIPMAVAIEGLSVLDPVRSFKIERAPIRIVFRLAVPEHLRTALRRTLNDLGEPTLPIVLTIGRSTLPCRAAVTGIIEARDYDGIEIDAKMIAEPLDESALLEWLKSVNLAMKEVATTQ